MNLNEFSPFIRHASADSTITPYRKIGERVIFDYELLYVKVGKIILTYEGEKHELLPGSIVLLRPNIPHTLEFIGNTPVVQPHIHFDTIYDSVSESVYISYHKPGKIPQNEQQYIRRDNIPCFPSAILKISDSKVFSDMFFKIIDIFQNQEPWYEFHYKGLMCQLLEMLICDNAKEIAFEQDTHFVNRELASIKAYIDTYFKKDITLESLEQQFHYDKFYISKIFKKHYGISIMKYYDNLRIEAAKKYLTEGKSVSEVTKLLNAGSIYNFSRFFKKKVGYPPSEHKLRVEQQ